ncbi:ISLre2 family transposase [Streptococcus suis]
MKIVDEALWQNQFQEKKEQQFHQFLKRYDEQMIPIMKARGYTCIRSAERTVAFTFGEFTFSRRKWKKGQSWICPIDDYLGLEKNARYSKELLYQIAELSTMMTYDSVVRVVKMTYNVTITKPTVVKVVKAAHELIEQYEDYQYYQEELTTEEKLNANLIYLEGDGVSIKVYDEEGEVRNRELSHFIVHTGSEQIEPKRWALQDKKSFVSFKNSHARRKLLDYLHQMVHINDQTILITNSDGGKGFSPYVFKEIAKALRVKRHEHFWDPYHVNNEIERVYRSYPEELKKEMFRAIHNHDKKVLRTVLDTTESLIQTEEEEERFSRFSKRIFSQFQYTKSPKQRGFEYLSLGTMESQHRKLTYRMKRRGMVWSLKGANAMSNMILFVKENRLRELFFGSWREEYQKIQQAEGMTGGQLRIRENNVKRDEARYSLRRKW